MFSLIRNYNPKILDLAIELRENLNYIKKFDLPADVAQYIDSCFIINDVQIDNPTIASDVKLNS